MTTPSLKPASAKAPVMLLHFTGAMDAGGAGHIAVQQMLNQLHSEVVTVFDSDDYIDYRSHRPIMTIEDWVTKSLDLPEIVVERVIDDLGTPFLIAYGPEPDMRWQEFADELSEIAINEGVELTVSLHGVPAGTPHTRPAQVHIQSTNAALIPQQPHMMQPLQFPAPITSFVQERLSHDGIDGIALLGSVPFYMSDRPYPAVASAMLSRLSEMSGLALPVGDLEQHASQEAEVLTSFIEENPEVQATVTALETHYDAMVVGEEIAPLTSLQAQNKGEREERPRESIGDVIEAYLANIARTEEMTKAQAENDFEGVAPVTAQPKVSQETEIRSLADASGRVEGEPEAEAESDGSGDESDLETGTVTGTGTLDPLQAALLRVQARQRGEAISDELRNLGRHRQD